MSALRLPPIVAAGQVGWKGPGVGDTFTRAVATIDDWIECCEAARLAFSRGTKAVPAGATWEESIALLAARYLIAGATTEWPPMGRPDPWPDGEEQRWIDAVFDVAARGSDHDVGAPGAEIPTGTVLTAVGRVALDDVPRSEGSVLIGSAA